MAWLIIWLFCGVAAAAIAGGKNRSVVGWLLLGFLFGPLAFIVAALPKLEQTAAANTPVPFSTATGELSLDSLTKQCPACAEEIKFEAVVCRFCGHQFDQDQVAREAAAQRSAIRQAAGMQLCPTCNKPDAYRDANGGLFCPHCRHYI